MGLAVVLFAAARPVHAQHEQHGDSANTGRWALHGMGQIFPVLTVHAPGSDGPLRETEAYLTQGAFMLNLISPGRAFVLHTTLNLEGITQEDGELTAGSWGEGFLDRRHPHTFLHELMVSFNTWDVGGGAFSISAGKGFTPFGTDDPMVRPGLKYPTNHHLSQILERWNASAAYVRSGWSFEAGVFAGEEPEDAWDLDSFEGFGSSWSARVAKRWSGFEAAASFGSVEEHGRTSLWNAALRVDRPSAYALLEASWTDPEHGDGYYSALAETRFRIGVHRPYARLEVATRPEYARLDATGDDFFRYDHDAEAIGATRWIIATGAWAWRATGDPVSIRPFVEVQFSHVRGERGIDALSVLSDDSFWSLSFGARVYLGGRPERMGAYGVLDPMTPAMTSH